jgi:succinate dehydrogenase / fumarate reductase iron-sulfur subunit
LSEAVTGAKIAHLGLLPQGQPERSRRAIGMLVQMSREAFRHCTSIGECEAVCPKQINLEVIARMNGDFLKATVKERHKQRFREDEPAREPLAGGRR